MVRFKATSFYSAFSYFASMPKYSWQDFKKRHDLIFEDHEITKVEQLRYQMGRSIYRIHYQSADSQYHGFLFSSELPKELEGRQIHSPSEWECFASQFKLFLRAYANLVTLWYIISMLVWLKVLKVFKYLLGDFSKQMSFLLVILTIIVPPVATYFFYRWRKKKERNIQLLLVLNVEASLGALILAFFVLAGTYSYFTKAPVNTEAIEMASKTEFRKAIYK